MVAINRFYLDWYEHLGSPSESAPDAELPVNSGTGNKSKQVSRRYLEYTEWTF